MIASLERKDNDSKATARQNVQGTEQGRALGSRGNLLWLAVNLRR